MTNEEAFLRIDFLTQELNKHNYQYYVLDNPSISDYDFDMLLNELILLEKTFPQYRHDDSPSQRVGGEVMKKFEQVKHKFPMLSLGNTYSEIEVADFYNRISSDAIAQSKAIEYVCELKFDGTAISLWYEKGLLVRAVTRGDGVQGDDVTHNIKTIPSIPLKLQGDFPSSFEIRGEVIMPHKSFEMLNIQRIDDGYQPFANPRNAASGSLKMLDSKEVAKRKLDCFLYGIYSDNLSFNTHSETLQAAQRWGFKVSPHFEVHNSLQGIYDFIHEWDSKRKNLPFDTDGAVIKVDDFLIQKQLGFTAKTPRWAVAYKYKAERALTQLVSVDFQVGRTGAVTPVANLVPVALGGTTVKRATLHNADVIQNLDLHHYDFVYLEKGGEIIPKIVSVELSKRLTGAPVVDFISTCPECNTPLIRVDGEAANYCPNTDNCPPQIKGKLEHFIGRKAMNIDSLGEGKIELLFDQKIIKNFADLYQLTYEKLIGLEKIIATADAADRKMSFREKTVSNILDAIEKSKSVPFERVLFALGIRFVGETVAKKIARSMKNIQQIKSAIVEDFIAIDDVGIQIANSIVDYLKNPIHLEMIDQLIASGLQFEVVEQEIMNDILLGKSFVVSGKFTIPRDDLKSMIEKNGGKNVSSISSKTDYVLAGESMGPEKFKKAQSLNIPIISEEDFNIMINK
ncbi:MAG: NAD-dependent DNA ligase LigA [Bacteroidota bacterium]